MNKREELLSEYTIQDDRITSPGKFQGERVYVPYFWEKGLEGWADYEADDDPVFIVMPEDRGLFPELNGTPAVRLHEDSQGFVREVPVDKSVESY